MITIYKIPEMQRIENGWPAHFSTPHTLENFLYAGIRKFKKEKIVSNQLNSPKQMGSAGGRPFETTIQPP
jgi:hypothetical protein